MSQPPDLPEAGLEVYEHFRDHFRAKGSTNPDSEALELAELLVTVYAGETIRFPSSGTQRIDLARRNEEILALWNGSNASELAERFGLTRPRIWQIVRAAALNRKQGR